MHSFAPSLRLAQVLHTPMEIEKSAIQVLENIMKKITVIDEDNEVVKRIVRAKLLEMLSE